MIELICEECGEYRDELWDECASCGHEFNDEEKYKYNELGEMNS